ncbi:hypothetical protein PoB_003108500 [Plakobranchus ocellatus]|uniref:Uncharacterized protein n=1 Tax=Plakobranchus ocellatus TaxID=259542 RepID=A0AAV4AB30_9GAST|nr:hypothetical protein PoB_003108500 [Plakobranchus ocellatus]
MEEHRIHSFSATPVPTVGYEANVVQRVREDEESRNQQEQQCSLRIPDRFGRKREGSNGICIDKRGLNKLAVFDLDSMIHMKTSFEARSMTGTS